MSRAFLRNADYVAYARLLFRLHGLIATDAGESPDADDVRNEMDAAWSRLGAAERSELRMLSEQLYAFHGDGTVGAGAA
ncbi:MAG TPA: hypothetical protein VNT79_18905 [Phycisphaerae bacterium]|nr:hypothetical protein [Phycisphaerae bacterium]